MMELEEAKAALPIPTIARALRLEGDYTEGKQWTVPWRIDNHPSLSIWEGGLKFSDWGRDDHGSAYDFFCRCQGLDPKSCESVRAFVEMAGGCPTPMGKKPDERTRQEKRNHWPRFHVGLARHWEALATLRNLHPRAIELAARCGVLRFAKWAETPAWIITDGICEEDGKPIATQARRMDGKPWEQIDAKAWTLGGSRAGHLIGLDVVKDAPAVALVEGGPDLLAAYHFIIAEGAFQWVPVALLGASATIPEEEAEMMRGKQVRIFPHSDEAGAKAAQRWSQNLSKHGAHVEGFNVSFYGAGDLNDLASDPNFKGEVFA